MAKNYNIRSVCKKFKAKSSHVVIGSSVAAGMTRYVTLVKVTQDITGSSPAAKGTRVVFCSAAASGSASNITAASTIQKLSIGIQSCASSHILDKTVVIPKQPDTENPLFTVAASKWLTATLGSAAGTSGLADVFVQYYDA